MPPKKQTIRETLSQMRDFRGEHRRWPRRHDAVKSGDTLARKFPQIRNNGSTLQMPKRVTSGRRFQRWCNGFCRRMQQMPHREVG